MPYLEKTIVLQASASDVWTLVGDFEDVVKLGGAFIRSVEVEGFGEGAIRTMHISDELGGGYIKERQVTLDSAQRYSDYDIIEPGAVPFSNYLGAVKVDDREAGGCVVRWSARFKVVGIPEEEGVALYASNLENIARELNVRFNN